jgi:hypothetical protein
MTPVKKNNSSNFVGGKVGGKIQLRIPPSSPNQLNINVGNSFKNEDLMAVPHIHTLKAIPRRRKKEFNPKGLTYVKYLIEDEEDGNIACPAFPFPLIDYDDFEEDHTRPWISAAEK